MDTSSEDSFAWTSTADDDSCAELMLAYEEESDFDKSFKKKLQKELFQNGDHEELEQETPRARKKKVKREPTSPPAADSDPERAPQSQVKLEAVHARHSPAAPAAEPSGPPAADSGRREPGRKRHRSGADGSAAADRDVPRHNKKARRDRSPEPHVNGDPSGAERLLRLKVKQERASLPASDAAQLSEEEAPRKTKKAKRGRSPEPAVDGEPADAEEPPPKKKKKKYKHETLDETPTALVEKFEAAETVVEARRASPSLFPAPSPSPARASPSLSPSPARALPPVASPRALKIRERITFEEDSVDRAEPGSESEGEREPAAPGAESAAPAGRLARYVRAHAAPRAPAPAAHVALGPEDDVWVLRAPRSLHAAALQGAALPLGRGRLKAGGRSYEVAPAEGGEGGEGGARAALLLPAGGGWRVRCVPVRGCLRLRVRVPRARAAPAEPEPPPAPAPAAAPPPAARLRHPLLGADFERALAPRPRHPTHDEDSLDVEKPKKKKKKKKRQREAEAEPAPERPRPGSGPGPGPGPRRRAPERWDSERAIEESLFGA